MKVVHFHPLNLNVLLKYATIKTVNPCILEAGKATVPRQWCMFAYISSTALFNEHSGHHSWNVCLHHCRLL